MTYQVIEWLGNQSTAINAINVETTNGDRKFSVPSVVEDPDGLRLLLLAADSNRVPAHVWHRAHAAGAAGIVRYIGLGEWDYVTTEQFMVQRGGMAGDDDYVCDVWFPWTGDPPTYADMVKGEIETEPIRKPTDNGTFVHLHTHSEYSPPDGFSLIQELVDLAVADGQKAFCLSDHGSCSGHVEQQRACDEAGIKPLFAMEAYFQDDRFARGKDFRYAYWHIVLIAKDDTGLKNLWALSTESNRDGLYDGRPRIDWELLQRYSEGLICLTGCLRSPVAKPLLEGNETDARMNFARLLDIFGDRLYAEIMPNSTPEQVQYNTYLIGLAKQMSVPVVVTVDSHYPTREDHRNHQAMMVLRRKKDTIDSESGMFADQEDYSFATEVEVRERMKIQGFDPELVEESIANTVRIAEMCTATIERKETIPVFSKPTAEHPDPIAHDVDRLLDLCIGNLKRKVGHHVDQQRVRDRFAEEMNLLVEKGFCGYFLIVNDYVNAAKNRDKLPVAVLEAVEALMPEGAPRNRTPILVGPGRGSGGGSLIAFLSDITEIDPIAADLLFARFLTPGRKELPDFDLDFPATEREWIKAYVRYRWGDEHVVTVGTVGRMQVKGAMREVGRIFQHDYNLDWRDLEAVSKVAEGIEKGMAGAHLQWSDWEDDEEAQKFAAKYPELFALSGRFFGRWRAFGKHPAGVVISTDEPLTGSLPLRQDSDGNMVTQFDMKALEFLGLVKFDLLTLRNLDTIQMCIDLIRSTTGEEIRPYDWREEYEDRRVWEELSRGHTLGVFQIETSSGTKMAKDFAPASVADLSAVVTLVRPGPKRSGLTDTYLQRRRGLEPVSVPDQRLQPVLSETFGCLVYQEDIMATTMVLAGYDGTEADGVRKILGKKLVDKVEEAGRVFVARAVENNTDPQVAVNLWAQMAEFAKYSFNKAHAFGYAVLSHWTAWLKFNYPVQFLTAALSTVDDKRIPEFVNEARRMGYAILPPDINSSGKGFAATPEGIRYGLDGIKGIGEAAVDAVVAGQPYTSFEDYTERCSADIGKTRLFVKAGCFDTLFPNRRALEAMVEWTATGADKQCVFKDPEVVGPNGLPCRFDWSSEPPRVGKSGKELKQIAIPKRCTVACRQYVKPEVMDVTLVEPYNPADIREIERELLGIYLSSTPFDGLDPGYRAKFPSVEEIEAGPLGEYVTAGIVQSVREKTDTRGGRYAFVTFETETGNLEMICFADTWKTARNEVKPDALLYIVFWKNDRGLSLTAAMKP